MNNKLAQYVPFYLNSKVEFYVFPIHTIEEGWLTTQKKRIPELGYKYELTLDKLSQTIQDGYFPILRRVKDITREEMKELYKVVFKREFPSSGNIARFDKKTTSDDPRWVLLTGVDRLGIEENGHVWADCDLHHYKHNQHEITRWFILNKFDVFNLIDSHLAVDEKLLNEAIAKVDGIDKEHE